MHLFKKEKNCLRFIKIKTKYLHINFATLKFKSSDEPVHIRKSKAKQE